MNCILQVNTASIEDIVKLYKQFCSSKIGSQIILHYKKLLYGMQVKIVPIISDMNSMIRLQADGLSRQVSPIERLYVNLALIQKISLIKNPNFASVSVTQKQQFPSEK